MIDICKFYKHKRGCTCPYACGGQLSSDNSICTSDLYYAKGLKQEYEELKSESFTRESLISMQEKDIDRYRKALEEIEKVCLEDTRTFADGTKLRYDSLDDILDIISKAKEKGMIKYYCDLCGKEIAEGQEYIVTIKDNSLGSDIVQNKEICHECLLWVFQRTKKREQLKEEGKCQ